MAPSGAYTAAVSFPARDVTQRLGGRLLGIAAIVVGGAISFAFSSPQIAAASAMTFLVSESADFLVYTPLSRRYFAPAVVISSIVAAIVDSILFLYLAGIPEHTTMVLGLIFAKLYIAVVAGAVIYILRKKLPERKI